MGGECTLNGIQIKNVRSLKDTEMLSLSPITVLVGENSSGKSTFLRVFPLLKQSICKRTSGPLLWAGDYDDYVDFGSFKETVTNDGSDTITFRFCFKLDNAITSRRYYFPLFKENQVEDSFSNVSYEITVVSNNGKESVSLLTIIYNRTKISFDLRAKSIFVDNLKIFTEKQDVLDREKDFDRSFFFTMRRTRANSVFEFVLPDISPVWEDIYQILHIENIGEETLEAATYQRALDFMGEELVMGTQLRSILTKAKKRFPTDETSSNILDCFSELKSTFNMCTEKEKERVLADLKLCHLYSVFPAINDFINTYFRQVHYIAPLRATAERYYRLRNLAVDEVDYQGKNLAVFLNSLSNKKFQNFQQWTLEHFGFSVAKSTSEGHLSIRIRLEDSKKTINLSDTGFGYSQILPIITQLWELSSREKTEFTSDAPLVIAIEQPELHLHPAMQAKLAKAFIASLRLAEKNGYQLQLILETHSETIVNYFGREIARGSLTPEDVSVILFEKNPQTKLTVTRTSKYSEEGFLQNWPYGFFEAGE